MRLQPGGLALVVAPLVCALAVQAGLAAGLNLTSQALTPYRTCVITATPAATTAVIDASVRQGSPATNFGTATTNNVATGNAVNRRLYIRFDLSLCTPAIPATATVRLATLRMFATGLPTSCRTVDAFRVTAAWTEAGITWNNQPFGTAINNPVSGSASDTFAIGTPVACQNATANAYIVGAIMTGDVAAFVAGTATNFGWMLRDDVEGSASVLTSTFSAKNLGTASQAPQLAVTYVTVP
jgi:hypothetical protein